MDQLGVVTVVLVLSTALISIEDIRRFFRRRASSQTTLAGEVPGPAAQAPSDALAALVSDLESEEERRVARAMTLVDKMPAARMVPALVQLLRHPREEVSLRAAKALLQLNSPESVEPLYLYFNSRGARV